MAESEELTAKRLGKSMIGVNEQQETYFAQFAELQKRLAGKDPSWLAAIRIAAFDRFAELGFPTTRHEEWKYTGVAAIARIPFRPAEDYLAPVGVREPAESLPSIFADCIPLHFYNGRYVEELTPPEAMPAGVKVRCLAQAFSAGSEMLERHFARHANYDQQAFVALNTAFMEQGAYVEISKNVVLDKPIFLQFAAGPSNEPIIYHPRVLVVVGQGSQASIVEQYLSVNQDNEGLYFRNAVTEVVVGENAKVDYIKEQDESKRAFHIATLQFQQERSSSVHTHSLAFGSTLAREEVIAVLDGPG